MSFKIASAGIKWQELEANSLFLTKNSLSFVFAPPVLLYDVVFRNGQGISNGTSKNANISSFQFYVLILPETTSIVLALCAWVLRRCLCLTYCKLFVRL